MTGLGFWLATVGGAMLGLGQPAIAQRAAENAVTSAQDAFGNTVGNESIGLYSAADVRGFSPTEAGNLRIEGLYFDRQGDTTNRIITGSTVRVGISAQSYPFPAPTGIADYHLRLPGDRPVVSAIATYGTYGAVSLESDAQVPLVDDRLSMGAGIAGIHERQPAGNGAWVWNIGGLFRWRPNDRVEITPFGAVNFRHDREGGHMVLTAGAFLPPRVKRNVFYGQPWSDLSSEQSAWGFVARADLDDDWTFRLGVFRSLNYRLEQGDNFFRNTQPNGVTDRSVVLLPGNKLGSYSGEARLSRTVIDGARLHTFHASFRGRDKLRSFGGGATIQLGPGLLGVPDPEPLPNYVLGPLNRTNVRQGTGGVAYEGLWTGVGELGVGVQKTFYRRRSEQPGIATVTSRDSPWLLNGTLAVYLRDDLAAFGSYTRGLEESGEAPPHAANRGESVAATRTAQTDAGLRYAITPRLRLVAGVFEVKKPFFNLNTANVFTRVGDVRHRGVELSVTGQPIDGLTVVAGTVLLQARISGEAVASGRSGRVPLGRTPRVVRLNMQYGPAAWAGLSLESQFENAAGRYANIPNTLRTGGSTTINLGARHRFKVGETSATLRLQALNVSNVFTWVAQPTGTFSANEQRRLQLSLTADF